MNVKDIVIPSCRWDKTTGIKVKKERIAHWEENNKILAELSWGCLCHLDNENEQCGNNYRILRRIGSESVDAEVYEVRIEPSKIKMAMKILPIIERDSEKKHINELTIAQEASNLVLEGKSDFFPLVYAISTCENINYEFSSKLGLLSHDWNFKQAVVSTIKNSSIKKMDGKNSSNKLFR